MMEALSKNNKGYILILSTTLTEYEQTCSKKN